MNNKHINFWQSIFYSIFKPTQYILFLEKGFLPAIMANLLFVFLLSLVFITSFQKNFFKLSAEIMGDLPSFKIINNKAIFNESLELPYIKKFTDKNGVEFRYIIASNENNEDIEALYNTYILFTEDKIMIKNIVREKNKPITEINSIPYSSKTFETLFGEQPLEISVKKLASILSRIMTVFSFLILPILLFIFYLFSLAFSIIIALIMKIMTNPDLPYIEILKLSFYATIPSLIIQIFSLLLLNNNLTSVFFLSSLLIQAIYLFVALRYIKLES